MILRKKKKKINMFVVESSILHFLILNKGGLIWI